MPRWTRDPVWIPERFRQLAPNRSLRTPPTPYETTQQWIRMYLNRKVNIDSVYHMLFQLRGDYPHDEEVQSLAKEALESLAQGQTGDLPEDTVREQVQQILSQRR
jgi:hypothetical protein